MSQPLHSRPQTKSPLADESHELLFITSDTPAELKAREDRRKVRKKVMSSFIQQRRHKVVQGKQSRLQSEASTDSETNSFENELREVEAVFSHNKVGNDPLEGRKIRTIFQASTGYCSLLFRTLVGSPERSEEETNALRRNAKLLRQWGEAYSVADGTLDHLPAENSEISDTILMFLVEIAGILCQRISSLLGGRNAKANGVLLLATEHMQSLLHHVRDKSSDDDVQLGDNPLTEDETREDTLQQCIADLHEYIQLLNELHPTIESLLPITEDAPGRSLKEVTDREASFNSSEID